MLLPLGGAPISISFRSGVSNTCPDLTASDRKYSQASLFFSVAIYCKNLSAQVNIVQPWSFSSQTFSSPHGCQYMPADSRQRVRILGVSLEAKDRNYQPLTALSLASDDNQQPYVTTEIRAIGINSKKRPPCLSAFFCSAGRQCTLLCGPRSERPRVQLGMASVVGSPWPSSLTQMQLV